MSSPMEAIRATWMGLNGRLLLFQKGSHWPRFHTQQGAQLVNGRASRQRDPLPPLVPARPCSNGPVTLFTALAGPPSRLPMRASITSTSGVSRRLVVCQALVTRSIHVFASA